MQDVFIGHLVEELEKIDISLWLEDGEVRFRGPQGSLASETFATLKRRKREVAAYLADLSGPSVIPPLTPRPYSEAAPANFSQSFWWGVQKSREVRDLNPSFELLLQGIELTAIRQALNALYERNAALRAAYRDKDGELWMFATPSLKAQIQEIDLRAVGDRQAAVEVVVDHIRRIREHAFEIEQGEVCSFTLARISEAETVLVVCIDRVACDHQALHTCARQILSFLNPVNSPRVGGGLQPADFGWWESEWLTGTHLGASARTWIEVLSDVEPLPLGTAGAQRWALSPFTTHDFNIGGELVERLRGVFASGGASVQATIFGALAICLSRSTGREKFALGMLFPSRTRDNGDTVGSFSRLQPLILQPSADKLVGDFVQEMENSIRRAENLRDVVLPEYAVGSGMLDFIVRYRHPDVTPAPNEGGGSGLSGILPFEPPGGAVTVTASKVVLIIREAADEIKLSLSYARDVLTDDWAMMIAAALPEVVRQLAEGFEGAMSDLPVRSLAEGPVRPC